VERYGASEFRIQSPGFPTPYSPELQCLYIVEAASGNICRLEADFLTFDLGDCTSGDHVIIAGQSLCGNLKGSRTFRFSAPRSLIQFRYRKTSQIPRGNNNRSHLLVSLSRENDFISCLSVLFRPVFLRMTIIPAVVLLGV
jgi:hypothetical protein